MLKQICKIIAVLLCLAAIRARAESDYRTNYGFDLRAIKTNESKHIGWLSGMRIERYLGKSSVRLGVGAYYGCPTGDNPTNEYMTYGGLSLGYDGKWGTGFYQLGLIVGYGEGQFKARVPRVYERSYFTVEPTVAAGFYLGKGWRLSGTTSYLHMNNAVDFSGLTFGFRLEFRTETTVRPLD